MYTLLHFYNVIYSQRGRILHYIISPTATAIASDMLNCWTRQQIASAPEKMFSDHSRFKIQPAISGYSQDSCLWWVCPRRQSDDPLIKRSVVWSLTSRCAWGCVLGQDTDVLNTERGGERDREQDCVCMWGKEEAQKKGAWS